jgi:excisionase family DNA binding protein
LTRLPRSPNGSTPQTALVVWEGSDDELLDASKAAALLTVKRSTLLAWAREERVPCVRLGPRHYRWTRPLLRQIVAERTSLAERV